jgi:hypothetical protein
MNAADKQIADILAQHGEDFQANTWVVAGGRTRAILHHCTERMAAKEGIKFDQPVVISAVPDNVVILVTGRNQLGAEAWSFGEAAPKNNKNAYPYSMAEKRAKDRVALKLLKLHGLVYSEAEADELGRLWSRRLLPRAPSQRPWLPPAIRLMRSACRA